MAFLFIGGYYVEFGGMKSGTELDRTRLSLPSTKSDAIVQVALSGTYSGKYIFKYKDK